MGYFDGAAADICCPPNLQSGPVDAGFLFFKSSGPKS
jgi:hypothetical protein